MQQRIALALDPDLLKRVDHARGDIPRAKFIQRALEAALSPNGQDSADPQRDFTLAGARLAQTAKKPKAPKTCPKHPDAGKMKSHGKTYCDYGGCQFVYS